MLPKIIHQTWKSRQLPPELATWQRTWQELHPDWDYRLWTDVDNRTFIEEHYGWFLPIFDHYPENIMRADAVRYFVLHHFGGVYADLDYECLRRFDPLTADAALLLGLEPPSHLEQEVVRERGFRQPISNALMASAPCHPFWPHVFRKLVEFRDAPGPLDAAGPFLITRAFNSFAQPETVTLLPPEVLFPIDYKASHRTQHPSGAQTADFSVSAYGIHHWYGSWVRPVLPPGRRMRFGKWARRRLDVAPAQRMRLWRAGSAFAGKRLITLKAWTDLSLKHLGLRQGQPPRVLTSIWQKPEPAMLEDSPQPSAQAYRYDTAAAPRRILTTYPRVLILCPVKNAVSHLPHFWYNLHQLSYPHHHLSLAFLESDSDDGTYDLIRENLPSLAADFDRVRAFKHDYGYETPTPRWLASAQYRRRSILARSRNQLLARALRDEDWVLWIDVDVMRWPSDVLEQMLAWDKDVITPNCLNERGETFDYNTYKLKPETATWDWSPYLGDGILQPPIGLGRLYLQDLRHHDLAEIDSVGGTMLLVRADRHREGLVFPAFAYKYLIETEGLAAMARDMGISCWGMPNLEIIHA